MADQANQLLKKCPTCAAIGFNASRMHDRCEFCDGTAGGVPPDDAEVKAWNDALGHYAGRGGDRG